MTGVFVHMFNAEFQDRMANKVAFGGESDRPMHVLSEKLNTTPEGAIVKGFYNGYKAGRWFGPAGMIVGPGGGAIHESYKFNQEHR